MLCFGECRLMVGESINGHSQIPRTPVLYPEDISQCHGRVCENGLDAPGLQISSYGMTEFRLEDPDGNRLWNGQGAPASNPPMTNHDRLDR